MLYMEEKELNLKLQAEYQKGFKLGIKLMEQRLQLACENGNPINIEGRAYFIKSDMENLRDIFDDIMSDQDDKMPGSEQEYQQIKNEVKQNLIKDLSFCFAPDQMDSLLQVFDVLTEGYDFAKKTSGNIEESVL